MGHDPAGGDLRAAPRMARELDIAEVALDRRVYVELASSCSFMTAVAVIGFVADASE
jgi:hypothetical protein